MLKKIETLPEWLNEASERNLGTLWQVIKAYRANLRQGTVGVKTRAMVSSTGKKPYKQKKTGNARRGSFVSPICVGGGVAHGPKARDYRQNIPEKMASLALKIALCQRIKRGQFYTGEVSIPSGKTKDASGILNSNGLLSGKKLICLSSKSSELSLRAFKNIPNVALINPMQINAYDVVRSQYILMSDEAFNVLVTRLTQK